MTLLDKNLTDVDIEEVRSSIPALENVTCFNTGMEGPMPTGCINAIQKATSFAGEKGTFTKETVTKIYTDLHETKCKLAKHFKTQSKNICLAQSTTVGLNLALGGFNWSNKDEIVITKHEHPSILYPVYLLKERYGVNVRIIDVDFSSSLKSIKENINKNTKAVALSHVFWESGNCLFDIKEIIDELRDSNIISIFDGAQSAGAIKLDLDQLKPDFYSIPGQKWLLGPRGTGLLYINDRHLGNRPPWPLFAGFDSAEYLGDKKAYDFEFNWTSKKDAGLFEFGGLSNFLFNGLGESVKFISSCDEKFSVYERINKLNRYFLENLKSIKGINVITSEHFAGLVVWEHKDKNAVEVVEKLLKENKIAIRNMTGTNLCRTSIHFFNKKDEIDLLLEALSS